MDEMERVTRENEINEDNDGGGATGIVSSAFTVMLCLLVVNF